MGIMNIKISDYCKSCAFLCKTDKEYCPNHMNPVEAQRKADEINILRMRKLAETLKEEK